METKNILKVTFTLLGVLSLSTSEKPIHQCVHFGAENCQFYNIVLNSTHYEWQPTAEFPDNVIYSSFGTSIIPIFTKGVCELFPLLQQLFIRDTQVVEVKEDAFDACLELTHLYLSGNRIKRLHPDTFQHTKSMRVIHLEDNQIECLDHDELFANSMPDLITLHLNNNNLTEFSPELVKNCHGLRYLDLYSNDLSDIDVVRIVEYRPNLKRLWLDDNEISCVRMVEILSFLEAKGIESEMTESNKTRYYPQQGVFGGFKCNPDVSWMASAYRKENLKFDHRLDEIEKSSLRNFEEVKDVFATMMANDQESNKKINEIDQRLDEIDEKLEILVKLMSTLKQ